jgi:hypothetical protein
MPEVYKRNIFPKPVQGKILTVSICSPKIVVNKNYLI